MNPYFSRLAQRSFSAPSRSIASDAGVDSASDWNERSETIAAAPADRLASPDRQPRLAAAAVELPATMANSVVATSAVPLEHIALNSDPARAVQTTVIPEAKVGGLPHHAGSTAGSLKASPADRRWIGSDPHALAATSPNELLPAVMPVGSVSDLGEQSTRMSSAIGMTLPRSLRADTSSASVALDAADERSATSREVAPLSPASRSSARAANTAPAQPEAIRAKASSYRTADTFAVHIGRVDIEVAAAPARQTMAPRFTPPATPSRVAPATTFNPHRYYLRSP